MDKKIVKLAVIRTNSDGCPFGLSIPFGCKMAGEVIKHMAPLLALPEDADEEDKLQLIEANKKLLLIEGNGERCFFAGKIFKENKAVECNFGSNAPGISEDNIAGAPFYSKVYNDATYDGLYAYPLGWYGDSNISRNLYYGAFSTLGSKMNTNYKKASEKDINDALKYFKNLNEEDEKTCFKYVYDGDMLIDDVLSWGTYSDWGFWKSRELENLKEKDLFDKIKEVKGEDWAKMALSWINSEIPPIILLYTDRFEELIADGKSRVSLAVGLGLDTVPVIILNQDKDGNICI